MRRVWLISKRLEKGLNQIELAEKVGISNRTLSNIELGNTRPGGEVAYKIAKCLDFDMKIFYEEDRKSEEEAGAL